MFDPANEQPSTCKISSLLFRLAIPASSTNTLECVSVTVNIVFAGHMSDLDSLAAVGLSTILCEIMVLSVIFGLNAAHGTLTS